MTHQIIKILCYAKDKKEARERAEDILNNNLVGDGKAFDYGNFFDDDDAKARWGNFPPVVLADTKEGKRLIKEGMRATKEDFKRNLKEVRRLVDFYSNEELVEGEVIDIKKKILEKLNDKDKNPMGIRLFKYFCFCLGQYQGTCVWLYDDDGSGIRDSENLKNVLNKWGEKKDTRNCYIVPIDVHS